MKETKKQNGVSEAWHDNGVKASSSVVEEKHIPSFLVVGDGTTFGDRSTFGNNTLFGNGTKFGNWTTFGNNTLFGNGTKFGNWTTFGNDTSFGDGTTFGNGNLFGNGAMFGKDTTYSNFPCRKIVTMSNIDGTGRQIVCVIGEDLCMIEAGCFWGTLNEFVAKARREDKLFYANCVSSFCKAVLKTLKENEQEK